MKISGINNIQNGNPADKTSEKVEQKTQNTKNEKEIISNSLSEAIGRSQVAFKGTNRLGKDGTFKHECIEKGEKENILYDPKTGNFKHEKFSKKGEFLSSIEYDNATQTKTIKEKQDNNTTKIVTEKKGIKTTQVFTEKGNPLSEIIETGYGSTKSTTWDYKKGRILVTEFNNTRVYDLKTGKEVFDGDLVYKDRNDKVKNVKYTYNVRTGKVIKEKHYDKKNRLIGEVEFDEITGKITQRTEYGKKDGEYRTFTYDKKTFRLVSDENSTNKGRNVRTKTFDPYTTKMTSDFEEIFDGDILVGEIEYYLESDRKKVSKIYNAETCEISHFNYNGNIELFEIHEDGKPIQVDSYDKKTGQKIHTVYTDYARNKKITDTYNAKGNVNKRIIQSLANGVVLEETLFYLNGKPKETHKWNDLSNTHYTEFYNPEGIRRKSVTEENNRIKNETNYYPDGETKKDEKDYYSSGECFYTEYYEDGRLKNMTEFDKYGNVKTPNYEQPKAKAKSNNYNTQANSNPKRDAELNFLKKVLNAVSSRNNDAFYQMEDKTWQNLAKVLGCEDYTLLKNGDRKEYIRLMKEYHPDICEDKEKGEIVTKILNAIREG